VRRFRRVVRAGRIGIDSLAQYRTAGVCRRQPGLDTDGAGQVYRPYTAAFNRTPDLGGLGGWIAGRRTQTQAANSSMVVSAEFQSLYGASQRAICFVSRQRPAPRSRYRGLATVDQLT
jgi:hypothetical protein